MDSQKDKAMRAISLWQPWASLIPLGAKKIETRSWSTKYRGPLLIHAAKRWTLDQEVLLSVWNFQSALGPLVGKPMDLTAHSWPGVRKDNLPFGAIIGLVDLVDCVPTGKLTL
jgi:hypothetical protein